MEDVIRGGIRSKVLLLSATPVNTDLKDLRNQIYFITEGADDAFTREYRYPKPESHPLYGTTTVFTAGPVDPSPRVLPAHCCNA